MKRGKRYLLTAIVVAAALVSALGADGVRTRAQEADGEAMEDRIIALHNRYREEAGLQPLTETDALNRAADVRAAECCVSFSHVRPDGSAWWSAEPAYAYGENLARGYATAEEAVDAWRNSAVHRYNMMNPEFRTLGVGVVLSGGEWFCVAEFGY